MSDVVPGTHVRMRVTRAHASYNVGDLIAVEFWAARELDAKRLARPIDLLVPTPVAAGETIPQRQPAQVVRK